MSARIPSDSARTGRAAAALVALAVALPAQTGGVPHVAVDTEFADAVRSNVQSQDPELRSEAALVLALCGAPTDAGSIRDAATTLRDADDRARGLLAVAVLAAPGAEATLGAVFDDADPRDALRHVAAFALGLLPEDHLAPALDRYFATLRGANHTRERDTVASVLIAATLQPRRDRRVVLETALTDPSHRDPRVPATALRALAALPDGLAVVDWAALLDSDAEALVDAALCTIAEQRPSLGSDVQQQILRLAIRGRLPSTRAAALDALVALRSPRALQLAGLARKTAAAELFAAGVAVALQLGGGSLRDDVGAQLAGLDRDDARLLPALARWRGALPACLSGRLRAWLGDRSAPVRLRIRAADLLLRDAPELAVPRLRELVASLDDPQLLADALRTLGRAEPAVDDLPRLLACSEAADLPRLPCRIEALSRVGAPLAGSMLLAALRDARLSDAERAAALRAWRRGHLPQPDPLAMLAAPVAVRALLAQ
ncbi:MAG: hypothetical protein IPM29_15380 [Planctomycetes bacterium]|nr:hypothetical protein [Planctomycetota bacterium]